MLLLKQCSGQVWSIPIHSPYQVAKFALSQYFCSLFTWLYLPTVQVFFQMLMLHVISARCVARDLHTTVPGPLERTCWRRFAAQWGDCKKSRIAPLNAIIIISYHYHNIMCVASPSVVHCSMCEHVYYPLFRYLCFSIWMLYTLSGPIPPPRVLSGTVTQKGCVADSVFCLYVFTDGRWAVLPRRGLSM